MPDSAGRLPGARVVVIALALGSLLASSACTADSRTNADSGAASTVTRAAPSAATSAPSSLAAKTRSSGTTSTHSSARPSATPLPSGSTIVIPPNLCAATDTAQNTADAYMGALSAGDEKQALDCVLPHTVPLATTRALVAHEHATAVYLPEQGVDGPTVFGYVGNGKTVRVTVTRESDGKTWVTRVVVR
jgi:hypothetical protein